MKSILTSAIAIIMAMTSSIALSAETKAPTNAQKDNQENITSKRMAVVTFSESHLREEPDYTAELGTQALMGSIVEIIAEEGYWRQVVTSEPYTAWCTDMGLVEMNEEALKAYQESPKYICIATISSVREKPSESAQKISDLTMGCQIRIAHKDSKKGPKKIVKGKWAQVMLPNGQTGWTPVKDLEELNTWMDSRNGNVTQIIKTAKMFMGTPYLWGGATAKGLDCSGLTRLVWYMNGRHLPRNASQQVNTGREIIMDIDHSIPADSFNFKAEMVKRIKNLKPGDLIFFGTPGNMLKKERITHVGIYIGNGRFIHSSQIVRINSLIPGSEDYYSNSYRLLHARRF